VPRSAEPVAVPEALVRAAHARGAHGLAWLADLPDRMRRMRDRWDLVFDEVCEGGTAALAVRVRAAGRSAVLKLAAPGTGFGRQLRTLAAARGRGYAYLYAYDLAESAALLEPLGTALAGSGLPAVDRHAVLAALLRDAWRVPRPATTGPGPAERLAFWIRRLDAPAALAGPALRYAGLRDASSTPKVVCHGDPHPGNALAVPAPRAGADTGYALIDPAGVVAEPAYDAGLVVARSDPRRVLDAPDATALVRADCAALAAATGTDPQAVWEWAFVERVASGVHLRRFGDPEAGRAYLDCAAVLSVGR
jgi:streptomycin 6-kinase